MKTIMMVTLAMGLAGCASSSQNIQASYTSPIMYDQYSCQQLAEEARRISARAAQVAGVQDSNRSRDAALTTVGVILFWPVLFGLEGNGQTAAELANLKGQMKAIEETSIRKNCGITFREAPVEQPPTKPRRPQSKR